MIADQMPFITHPPDDVRVQGGMLARHKKSGFHAALLQAVQKLFRIGRVRAVIEGNRYLFLFQILLFVLLRIRTDSGREAGRRGSCLPETVLRP